MRKKSIIVERCQSKNACKNEKEGRPYNAAYGYVFLFMMPFFH